MNRLLLNFCLLLAINAAANFFAFAQPQPLPAASKTKIVEKVKVENLTAGTSGQPSEKAIETVARPNIIVLCAAAETVTVRGWLRNEVRVLIVGGTINFKVRERGENGKPAVLMIQNADAPKSNQSPDECLHGETIEIEAPINAAVTIRSKEGDVLIDSIAKATVKNESGNISLRNVQEEVAVASWSGNVAVEDSAGKISITTFGDIVAFRCKPNDFGDAMNLNSAGGGDIVLRDARHKNIEAKSASGAIAVLGSLEPGGSYDFTTLSGSVTLHLPVDFPFSIRATMTAGGSFQTDFPLKPNYQYGGGQTRQMQVTNNNGGDTIINLITVNGSFRLKKK